MSWDRPRSLDPARPPGRRRSRANPSIAFRAICAEWAHECLRVLKPGGHLAAFAAPRTAHLLACGVEDAGFELRDTLMWIQGRASQAPGPSRTGAGTGLKPAYEPIILAREPVEGALDQTLAGYGTGALNIDACRVGLAPQDCPAEGRTHKRCRKRAWTLARQPAPLPRPQMYRQPMRTGLPDRATRGAPPLLLRRQGSPPRARGRLRAATQARRANVQDRRVEEEQAKATRWPTSSHSQADRPHALGRTALTPPGGLVLDPFARSGSTGAAVVLEAPGTGIECERDYIPIARARVEHWTHQPRRAAGLEIPSRIEVDMDPSNRAPTQRGGTPIRSATAPWRPPQARVAGRRYARRSAAGGCSSKTGRTANSGRPPRHGSDQTRCRTPSSIRCVLSSLR